MTAAPSSSANIGSRRISRTMRMKVRRSAWGRVLGPSALSGRWLPSRKGIGKEDLVNRRPRSLPGDENRTAGVAHDAGCIGADQVILHGRPMRSDDDEIGLGCLGDPQNLGIDAGTMRHENVGLKVGSIGAPD